MKPIYDYFDYRQYMMDFYKERKSLFKFTWRKFAQAVGLQNPVYLKQVCDGKYNLGPAVVERVARAMELVGTDITYFRILVRLSKAKTEQERLVAYSKLRSIAEETRPNSLNEDAAEYFESWKGATVREIASALNSTDSQEISDASIPEIPPEEVQKTVQLLVRLGVLHIDSDMNVHLTSRVISMQEESLKATCGTRIQRQMAEFAFSAMDAMPRQDRNMSGLTFGTSMESYERIKKEIVPFRKRVAKTVDGVSQKGPYVKGSQVNLYELDGNLKPTGKVFPGEIFNDRGEFSLAGINLESQFVHLLSKGYYICTDS